MGRPDRGSGVLAAVSEHCNGNRRVNCKRAGRADGVHERRSRAGFLNGPETPTADGQEQHDGGNQTGIVAARDDGLADVDNCIEKRQVYGDKSQTGMDAGCQPK